MIYTITLNPCLDYNMKVDDFTIGITNISNSESIYPGGKGINVSMMLSNLGVKSTALAFKSGFTGEYIESVLKEKNIDTDFIDTGSGNTRINIKIKQEDSETELNGSGPTVTNEHLNALFEKLDGLSKDDIVIISGSIPSGVPMNIYEVMCRKLNDRGVLTVVDARKDLLKNILKYKPFLIKPNIHELEELFGVKIEKPAEVIHYATKLKYQGAKNVLISMGKDGAILLSENGNIIKAKAPQIKLVNSVAAGDSMVAGFVASYLKDKDYEKAFKLGVACGSATASNEWLGESDQILDLFKQVKASH